MRRLRWGLLALILIVPPSAAAPVEEIRALIEDVAASDCRFYRNGEWHTAEAAAAHLRRKLRIARWMGRSGTAEDFIEQAGSRSSVSGERYRVQCTDEAPRDSADWLRELLRAVRATDDAGAAAR
ncbi:DUF5329 family protein [Algiphilus sp.]|uniref:DUF5329 family protein n=1 Tax=Algiphilus sp. TaxID=1872431 RepID=UPI003B530280